MSILKEEAAKFLNKKGWPRTREGCIKIMAEFAEMLWNARSGSYTYEDVEKMDTQDILNALNNEA